MTEPFEQRLRRLVAERGLTQASLARRLGVNRSTVHSWCWGVTEPSIARLRELARILGCTLDDLIGR